MVDFNVGYHPVALYLVPYLVSVGYPGITLECTVDIKIWVGTHIRKWLTHPVRKEYVSQGDDKRYKLNKQGWEELLRVAEIVVKSGVVKLRKRRGVE